jgi:eukaryotic-like serine/threonine-protein kinase
VEGRSLRDLLRAEAPLDPNLTAEVGAEIASALAFAHRSGVVHRDVKPGNVLLTRTGNVKVTDFGIARAGASDALTQTGSVMGTATYFSPEQAQGEPVDGRSDVYSLGVVLYEMVTGVAPFSGDSPVAVAYKHVREAATPPSQRNPDVPTDLEHIILTAMAKDPDLRYQTADDLRADLLRFRRGRPLASAPVTALVTEVPTSATTAAATGAYAATMATPKVDDRGRSAEGAAYERKRRNPALVTTLVLLALALVIGGILFAAIKLGDSQGHVTVPNVVGENVSQATKDLEAKHLVADIQPVADSRPKNIVVRQNPASGASIEKGSNVTLFVSTGAAQKKIPLDIVNKSVTEAKDELTRLGFVVATEDKASDTVPKDFVVDSRPAPGTKVSVGSTVTLLVSTGPEKVAVPDVSGDTLDQARSELTTTGFFNFAPLQESSTKIPQGQVTRTDPPKGSMVAKNTVIKIYVSTGPTTVTVPQEVGKTEAAATADLEGKGFVVQTIEQASTPGNAGKVIDQNPSAGTSVEPKSTVVLTIGATAAASTTSTTGP